MHHLLSTAGLVLSGGIGFFTIGVAIVAVRRCDVAAYQRTLLLLLGSLAVFTASHWLVLIWPSHEILLDLLESVSYTGFLGTVYQFAAIHPRISRSVRRDDV